MSNDVKRPAQSNPPQPLGQQGSTTETADREVGTQNGTANNSSPSGAHLSELDLGDSGKNVDPSPFFEDSGKDGNADGSKD